MDFPFYMLKKLLIYQLRASSPRVRLCDSSKAVDTCLSSSHSATKEIIFPSLIQLCQVSKGPTTQKQQLNRIFPNVFVETIAIKDIELGSPLLTSSVPITS